MSTDVAGGQEGRTAGYGVEHDPSTESCTAPRPASSGARVSGGRTLGPYNGFVPPSTTARRVVKTRLALLVTICAKPVSSGPEIPIPPFERWPVHAFHADYGFAWYCTAQRALITQTTVSHARPAGGLVLCDWIDLALREDRAAIEASGGLFLLHDFRSLAGYDPETRVLINERIKLRKPGYARRTIMVVRPTPIWRMAMQVTDLTYAMLGLPSAKVTGDIARAVDELGDCTLDPRPPLWLRGR